MATESCPARPEPSSLTFTQGLLIGQLSMVLLFVAFVKFFIFGDTPSAEVQATQRAAERRTRTLQHKRSVLSQREKTQQPRQQSLGPPELNRKRSAAALRVASASVVQGNNIATILHKTYYRVDSHQPESVDWFNVLIAQTIAQFRADAQHDNAILTSLTDVLNSPLRPDFVDELRITELALGDEFPIFSNCRVIPVDEDGLDLGSFEGAGMTGGAAFAFAGGLPRHPQHQRPNTGDAFDDAAAYIASFGPGVRLQACMDVDLSDLLTLAIETKLLLNFPQPRTAVLPVALSVSIVRFSGTLRISFIPSIPAAGSPAMMRFSFFDDYRLDLSIKSLLGSRSRLQDVPKIAQLIESRLHRWFDERAVEPRFQEIALPSLWPRKKNTRVQEGSAASMADAASNNSGMASAPCSTGRAGGKEVMRELKDEARKEVEAEQVSLRMRRRHLVDDND